VQMGALATAVAGDVVDVVGPKLSKEAARGLREDLAPALADALREDLVRDDAVVRLATRDAMLGVADALNGPLGEALHDFSARERTDLLDAADAAGSKWESRFYAGIGALGALLLASVGLVVARSIEARRSTQAVHLLTTTIKSYEHDPAVHALAGKIKEQSGTGGAGIYLQKFFNKHPELKVKHPEKS